MDAGTTFRNAHDPSVKIGVDSWFQTFLFRSARKITEDVCRKENIRVYIKKTNDIVVCTYSVVRSIKRKVHSYPTYVVK